MHYGHEYKHNITTAICLKLFIYTNWFVSENRLILGFDHDWVPVVILQNYSYESV